MGYYYGLGWLNQFLVFRAAWIAVPSLVAVGLGYYLYARWQTDADDVGEEIDELIGGVEMGGTNIKLCIARPSGKHLGFTCFG